VSHLLAFPIRSRRSIRPVSGERRIRSASGGGKTEALLSAPHPRPAACRKFHRPRPLPAPIERRREHVAPRFGSVFTAFQVLMGGRWGAFPRRLPEMANHHPDSADYRLPPGAPLPSNRCRNPWLGMITRHRERQRRGIPLRRLSRWRSNQRLRGHEVPPTAVIPAVRNRILIGQCESERWTRRPRRRAAGTGDSILVEDAAK
jgi:hypothetical protein